MQAEYSDVLLRNTSWASRETTLPAVQPVVPAVTVMAPEAFPEASVVTVTPKPPVGYIPSPWPFALQEGFAYAVTLNWL